MTHAFLAMRSKYFGGFAAKFGNNAPFSQAQTRRTSAMLPMDAWLKDRTYSGRTPRQVIDHDSVPPLIHFHPQISF
jgi:hypothetical protein